MKRIFALFFVVGAVLSNFALPAYALEVDDRCMYDSESNDFGRVAVGSKGSEDEEEIDLNAEPGFSDYTVVYRNTYEYGTIKYGNFRNGTSGGSEYYDSVLSFNNSNSAGYMI